MNRIKELLQAKGMSQISCKRVQSRIYSSYAERSRDYPNRIGHRLGKCFNTVNLYAANRVQPPIPVLYQIADILEVDVRDLLISSKIKLHQ